MRNISAAVAAARSARAGIISHHLVWIMARARQTGAVSPIGFWDGDDHQNFTIAGQVRTYYGAGSALELDAIVQETGLVVRQHNIGLSGIAPEVQLAMRGYDVRLVACQVHRVEFSTENGLALSAPELVIDGEIDAATINTPIEGGEAMATLRVLSNAAFLTRPLTLKRSDEAMRDRVPGDKFMQYAVSSGTQGDTWGAKR